MPKGFYLLVFAQFASGLADNALMILGIHFLHEQAHPGWWSPLLKFFFTLSYVVLAGFVGPIADAFPKGRLMASMNILKLSGVLLLLCGLHPFLGFALAGMAAAVYAPAKYALVTESVRPSLLVKANAWLEVSVVLSVLLGVALGGWLTGWRHDDFVSGVSVKASDPWWVKTQMWPAFAAVCLIYLVSTLLNLGLKSMDVHNRRTPLTWRAVWWAAFWKNNRRLWSDPLGGFSLYVTSLCWGVGAVLQFAVLVWAQSAAGLSLEQGAYLQALVAVGVISGAVLSARAYQIFNARGALPWAVVLAVLLPCMAMTTSMWVAVPLLILAGCAGGMLLVPMNALLQHRGQRILTSGRSVAVQGFNENLSVLVMLGFYSILLAWQVPFWLVMLLLMVPLLASAKPWLLKWA
jgi:LPLT family lysophospholipid transporter-like MFS transporter